MKFDLKLLAKDVLAKRVKDNLTFRGIQKETKGKVMSATLQRIEAATQMPRADTLGDICQWLGKPVNHYFN